jgi:flavin-dependent dehydrogenase
MINADVTIIGGGPAGAIAGKILAQRGYEVVILEKSTFPRYKVCGCCLNEKAVKLLLPNSLQEKDYFPPYIQQKKIDLLYQGKKHSIDIPGGIIISRSDLDTFLIKNAEEAGCKVFQGIKARLNMFSLNVEGQNVPQLKSKIFCLATGLDSENVKTNFFGKKIGLRFLSTIIEII